MNINKIKQAISEAKEQLGWQGRYGIVLLALAGVFHQVVVAPLEQDASLMRIRMDAARAKAGIGHGLSGAANRQEELAAFYASLPNEKDVTDVLGSIYATAEAYGVQLSEASYHLEDKDRPRIEYSLNFPISGEYVQIRRFVFRILASYHAIALDQIDFQRAKIGEATLKANVKMTLFIQPSR